MMGPSLGLSGPMMGPSLGLSGPKLGPFRAHDGPKLGPFRAHDGPKLCSKLLPNTCILLYITITYLYVVVHYYKIPIVCNKFIHNIRIV
jgi:hypothetical protein